MSIPEESDRQQSSNTYNINNNNNSNNNNNNNNNNDKSNNNNNNNDIDPPLPNVLPLNVISSCESSSDEGKGYVENSSVEDADVALEDVDVIDKKDNVSINYDKDNFSGIDDIKVDNIDINDNKLNGINKDDDVEEVNDDESGIINDA